MPIASIYDASNQVSDSTIYYVECSRGGQANISHVNILGLPIVYITLSNERSSLPKSRVYRVSQEK